MAQMVLQPLVESFALAECISRPLPFMVRIAACGLMEVMVVMISEDLIQFVFLTASSATGNTVEGRPACLSDIIRMLVPGDHNGKPARPGGGGLFEKIFHACANMNVYVGILVT